MKKAIVFAAAALMASPAFASKARQAALGGELTGVTTSDDVQEVFFNPAKMFNFGDLLTVEYGDKEGGFFRSSGDTKYGVYFGNHSTTFNTAVDTINAGADGDPATTGDNLNLLNEQNPFEIFYGSKAGDMAWAVSFKYSAGEDKASAGGVTKSESMGLRAGVGTDMYEAYAVVGLSGSSKKDGVLEMKNEPTFRVGGEYFMGDSTVYADILTGGAKITPNGGGDVKLTNMQYTVGVETKIKGEGSNFFYGVALASTEQKNDSNDGKVTSMKLPVYAGIEADAASWLVVRGFVKQSVLLNSAKDEDNAGTNAESTGLTDTSAGLGAGLKFGKLMIDGALSAGNNGTVDSTDLMTNVSLNYWF